MDALVSAVQALQLQPPQSQPQPAAAAEEAVEVIDTSQPQRVGPSRAAAPKPKPAPPTPTFECDEAQQATVMPLVRDVNAQLEGAFDLSSAVTPTDKQLLLQFGTQTLLKRVCTPAGASSLLRLLKILTRTRTDLERTLYAPPFVLFLVGQIAEGARAPAAAGSDQATVLSDCVRLMLNMCIVNRSAVHAALMNSSHLGGAEESKEEKSDASAVAPSASSTAASTPAPSPPSPLLALVSSLPLLRNTATDRELVFLFLRILLFVLVESRLAREAIEYAQLYENLVRTVLDYTEGSRAGVDVRAEASESSASSSSAAASASASASASAPASASSSDSAPFSDPAENRKVAHQAVQVLTNLGLQAGPRSFSPMVPVLRSSDPALLERFFERVQALLSVGVEIPEEVMPGYKGDPVVTEAVEAAAKVAAAAREAKEAAAAAEAAAGADGEGAASAVSPDDVRVDASSVATTGAAAPKRPASPTSVPARETSVSSSSAAAPAAAAAASAAAGPTLVVPNVQRQQTRIILSLLAAESAADACANATSTSLVQLQQDLATVLLGGSDLLDPMLPRLEARGCRATHAIVQLLHRQLVIVHAPAQKRHAEEMLTPLLGVLKAIVKASPVCRAHVKRCIFLDLATPPTLGPDGGPFRRADASNYGMAPAGALSERVVDPDPLCLRALMLHWVISLNFGVKQAVSELLFQTCDEDTSEYLRLLGFGNAVGLLAEKGLPGFGMLKQKAVNIDDVIKSGKKL